MAKLDTDLGGEWHFDPAHTRIGFSARHAMVTKVRGAFNEIDGRIHVDPTDIARSSVSVRLSAASVDTRSADRDAHLRSADFFDADRFPELVFTSTTVDEAGESTFLVIGDLTIKGITRQVAVPVELLGVGRTPDGELRAGFEGSRRVDRRDWGLQWQQPLDTGGVLVSEKITLELEISAVRVHAAQPVDAGSAAVTDPPAGVPSAAEQPAQPPTPSRRRGRHRARGSWWLGRG